MIKHLKQNWWVFAPILVAIWLTYASYHEMKNTPTPLEFLVTS